MSSLQAAFPATSCAVAVAVLQILSSVLEPPVAWLSSIRHNHNNKWFETRPEVQGRARKHAAWGITRSEREREREREREGEGAGRFNTNDSRTAMKN